MTNWTRILVTLQILGLACVAVGIVLPVAVAHESPTLMPYAWPAHHALYLHTTGDPAQCTVDDGVTEPFTISIPGSRTYHVAGRHIAALDAAATVTCTAPVTADLDPGVGDGLAGSPATDVLGWAGVVLTLWGARYWFGRLLRLVRGAVRRGGSGSSLPPGTWRPF